MPAKSKTRKAAVPKRRRLPPDQREKAILDEAIRYFAEVGFDAQTRELAKRAGITQPLLFRYFPTKQDLIDKVYERVYLNRWNPAWQGLIQDRALPLAGRLKRFYAEYYAAIVDYEWMRIFFQAGMRNVGINRRYLSIVRERIFVPLCAEARHANGLPDIDDVPIQPAELELYWGLHGSIIYDGIREHIYGLSVPPDRESATEMKIEIFLAGLPGSLRRVLAAKEQGVDALELLGAEPSRRAARR
jgi:AcrR family transcriptional regulator